MTLAQFIAQLVVAIPVLDKWVTEFNKVYSDYKFQKAELKARTEQNTEDLQKELGKRK